MVSDQDYYEDDEKLIDALAAENKRLREALSVAVDAMEDFDYEKRMAALAKCREVLK